MNLLLAILAVTIYLPIAISPGVTVQPNTSAVYSHVGGHVILGEVRNDASTTVGLLRVSAASQDGQSADTMVHVGRLAPGETGCFAIRTQSAEPWTDPALTVTYTDAASDKPAGIMLDAHKIEVSGAGYHIVSGTIRNTSAVTLTAAFAVVTLYDASGKVVGCNGASAIRETQPGDMLSLSVLPPGAVGKFRSVSPFLGGEVARYAIGTTAEVARR